MLVDLGRSAQIGKVRIRQSLWKEVSGRLQGVAPERKKICDGKLAIGN